MSKSEDKDPVERLVTAYETMLERVDELLDKAEKTALPTLRKTIEQAEEKAVELGELTREEAAKISSYVERDMEDAAEYIVETGEELRSWFQFDLELVESRIRDLFAKVADQTSLQLRELADRARQASLYHTGEITGPGTLSCMACGKHLHFHKTGHIPPCPECRATEFQRASDAG